MKRYFVKALEPTQNIYSLGLRWGVYLITDISPVAMGFFYDEPVAVAVCGVMNDGAWDFKRKASEK